MSVIIAATHAAAGVAPRGNETANRFCALLKHWEKNEKNPRVMSDDCVFSSAVPWREEMTDNTIRMMVMMPRSAIHNCSRASGHHDHLRSRIRTDITTKDASQVCGIKTRLNSRGARM